MDFINNHKFFNKLEYNVCGTKEYFTLTNTTLGHSTKKEQDLGTLFLQFLNLTDEELNNLGKYLGELKHIVDFNKSTFNEEKLLISKAKIYINKTLDNSARTDDEDKLFKIACELGYFKQITPIEYHDLKNIPQEIINNNYTLEKIDGIFEYCKSKKIECITKYELKDFENFIVASLSEIFKSKRIIKKCENCEKYFLAKTKRAFYCSNPSPQDPKKNCKKYAPIKKYEDDLKHNEAKKLHRTISKRLNTNKHRTPRTTEIRAAEDYKNKADEWKAKLKEGTITNEEYLELLKIADEENKK